MVDFYCGRCRQESAPLFIDKIVVFVQSHQFITSYSHTRSNAHIMDQIHYIYHFGQLPEQYNHWQHSQYTMGVSKMGQHNTICPNNFQYWTTLHRITVYGLIQPKPFLLFILFSFLFCYFLFSLCARHSDWFSLASTSLNSF